MASSSGPALAHRSVASIRSAPSQGGLGTPSSPHTPHRPIAASYGSPSTIRADDDIIIIQLGARLIKLGFAGDSSPKAVLSSGPKDQRRAGDFRQWQGDQSSIKDQNTWAEHHELWRHDMRSMDLGLFHDKLDRLLREAFTKYLLIDSKPRRASLVLDPAVPIPLLSVVLDTMFNNFQMPMICLVSSPLTTSIAAGTRSALIIDMGWTETVVTSLYEYREVKSTRTIRGGKYLLEEFYKTMKNHVSNSGDDDQNSKRVVSFEECEDLVCRLMWCRSSTFRSSQRQSAQLETVEEQDETEAEMQRTPSANTTAKVQLQSADPPRTVEMSFEKIADACEDTFFGPSTPAIPFDDHELPAHLLVYRHLLNLPIDVRAVCMARIIFTGGCSNILGIKERIIDEVTSMVERRGWEPVSGKGADQVRNKVSSKSQTVASQPDDSPATPIEPQEEEEREDSTNSTPRRDSVIDPIEAKIARNRPTAQQIQGQIRVIHSLGPWAGASLLSQLKVPAMATVDRELWMQQGAHGASRATDVDVKAQQRQSLGAGGLIRGSGGHHTNWTLGAWGAF